MTDSIIYAWNIINSADRDYESDMKFRKKLILKVARFGGSHVLTHSGRMYPFRYIDSILCEYIIYNKDIRFFSDLIIKLTHFAVNSGV